MEEGTSPTVLRLATTMPGRGRENPSEWLGDVLAALLRLTQEGEPETAQNAISSPRPLGDSDNTQTIAE